MFTLQLEWKQQYGNDEPSPNPSKKQQYISEREETVKEKVTTLLCVCLLKFVSVFVTLGDVRNIGSN